MTYSNARSAQEVRSYVYVDAVRDDILRMIPADGQILGSVGCGFGSTEAVLVEQGRAVHGVDISSEAIQLAKTRLTSARVISPDERMPFEADSLDGLILADVIEHIPLAWEHLVCFAQAVKPGGWVAISVPNMRYICAVATYLFQGDWPESSLGIFDSTHVQFMTHKRLKRWCSRAQLVHEQWFDRYDYRFFHRNVCRVLNRVTWFRLRSLLTFEVQGVFRRRPELPT